MVEIEIEPHEEFEGVYWAIFEDGRKKPATENLVPGHQVYGIVMGPGEQAVIFLTATLAAIGAAGIP